MKQKRLLCWMLVLFSLVFLAENSFAQALITVKGAVLDKGQNAPLAGVSVTLVSDKRQGTITDANGKFELKVPLNSFLQFDFIGYKSLTVEVKSEKLNVTMSSDSKALDEVVVVGYGTQKKASLTHAVTSIKSNEIALIPTTNLTNVLAGRLSGSFVRSGTGTPGISSDIKVRAQSSWNGGSPLFVIDGVVRDQAGFDALDPNEVAEITILKDAASAAIYGSRSSNGVILVNTKTGKSGKAQLNFSSVFSSQRTGALPEYMDVSKALDYSIAVNGGISPEEKAWVLKNNPKGMNAYNEAYQNPNNQRHTLSVSGGTDSIKYYLGGSYVDENGFLPNVWYKRYNLRGNVEAKITKNLSVGLNLGNNYGTRNRFNFTYDGGSVDLNNLWGKLLYFTVFQPSYINGKPVNPGWLGNPIEMMKNGGYWKNNNQQLDALMSIGYKIEAVPGLSLKATLSKNTNNSYTKSYAKKQLLYNFETSGANNLIYTDKELGSVMSGDPGTEYLSNDNAKSNSFQFNGFVNYDRTFGDHSISASAIYEQWDYKFNATSVTRNNFPLMPIDQIFATSKNTSDWSTGGSEFEDGRLSYIGRINYSYADKYLVSASVREDGSVRFAPNQRWGTFPSVSGGWVVSKENFFQNASALSKIDLLKLRLSYGSTGNDAIGGWQWQDQYNIQNASYYMGSPGAAVPRLAYGGIPNSNLTWEKSTAYNLGLDLKMFDKLEFTAELWKKNNYDILGSRILAVPTEFGGALPSENYGKMDANGLELELGYKNTIGKSFNYFVKGNFGYATTTVKKRDVAANALAIDNPNGKTLTYGTGLQATGILKTQADLDKLPTNYLINGAKPELGMMNFADLSGVDGKPDGKIDTYDRIILGNYMGSGNAPYSFGLTVNLGYKRFSIETLFAGLAGFKNTYSDPWGRNFGGGAKIPAYHDDAWSTENPNGSTPKLYAWGDSRATYVPTSTFNTFGASFMRMKYLNLGYTIPQRYTQKLKIDNVKIFASGSNLFTLSKFKYYDPEVFQFMSYPTMKTFSFGLDVRF
ncbi:SusC/RagA family TonB-linked outer membrane protein [Solitalea koreensis]|uniref:TonB-linked outer membrane protein, SusC/RagA family n=1 Tax=Solitalea koreensis TaxID=543615 RepID=A0A521DJY3_9SPHI|nr:TonB-dependent receptor [Solitalea koreensis]SMO72054.1 TonB-linked outer membrane protein, SusC/RagA family [Solitalea koreensis]